MPTAWTARSDLHGRAIASIANKVLIDPYARGVTTELWDRGGACGPDDNLATSMRGVVIDTADYDWEGDQPLKRPDERDDRSTRCTSAASPNRRPPGWSTRARSPASIEKIPYLQGAGRHGRRAAAGVRVRRARDRRISRRTASALSNYWGYSTVAFFAPHTRLLHVARDRAAICASSATWSRRCTRRASR